MLGYDRTTRPDGIFTFTNYSHFGNGNNTGGRPKIYFCGVDGLTTGEGCMTASINVLFDSSTYAPPAVPTLTSYFTSIPPEHQPYGQYAALALNYLDPVGYPTAIRLPPIFKDHLTNADVSIFDRSQSKLVAQNTRNV